MFRQLIVRLSRDRQAKEFEQKLAYEQSRGHVLDVATDRGWYVTLGQTVDEFAHAPGGVLWLHTLIVGTVCRANLVHYVPEKRILIGDIEAFVENKGYGSTMLKNIIELATGIGAQEIIGNLASTDIDHFDKLKHFYNKHGFEVTMFDGDDSGAIKYRIQ